MSRRYQDSRNDVATILSEVARTGRSSGWCGDIEQRDQLARVLIGFGVVYTDDLWGTWEPGELHYLLTRLSVADLQAVREFARRLLGR